MYLDLRALRRYVAECPELCSSSCSERQSHLLTNRTCGSAKVFSKTVNNYGLLVSRPRYMVRHNSVRVLAYFELQKISRKIITQFINGSRQNGRTRTCK